MKGRLNSTVFLVVLVDAVALFAVLALAYHAGQSSPKVGILELGNYDPSTGKEMLLGFVLSLAAAIFTWIVLTNRVIAPVNKLAEFSERLSRGEFRARVEVESADDFGLSPRTSTAPPSNSPAPCSTRKRRKASRRASPNS